MSADIAPALHGELLPPTAEWRTPSRDEAEALAHRITAAHQELVAGLRVTVDRAADLGVLLADLKPRFRREWLYWLESHTPVSRRVAAMYMQLARARAEHDRRNWKRISNLGIAGALKDLRDRARRAPGAALTRRSSMTPALAAPIALPLRGSHDRDDGLVDQICVLLLRLREVADKTTGAALLARVPDRLMHNLDLALPPAAQFVGDLMMAHSQANVRRAMATAEHAGLDIDEDTTRSFETVMQWQSAP